MQKITTHLWFDNQAVEAAEFYTKLFDDSEVLDVARYPEGSPAPAGSVMTVRFRLAGQEYVGLNGGPHFTFNEAISLFVSCADQAEVDFYWDRLGEGGEPGQCGWIKDRFGLWWQIIPTALPELLSDPDPQRAQRATQAMLTMSKIDVAALRAAADQSA